MFSKKSIQTNSLKLVNYLNGDIQHTIILDKSHILIGQTEKSDFQIIDSSISHYHALILMSSPIEGHIIDLESQNGIFVNGDRVQQKAFFNIGDKIRLGDVEFFVEEMIEESVESIVFEDFKKNTVEVEQDSFKELTNLPPKEGLSIIDGEYCDIEFNEDHFKSINIISKLQSINIADQYIEFEEELDSLEDIEKENENKALQVMVLSMGNVLSIDYFPLENDKDLFISGKDSKKSLFVPILEESQRIQLAKIQSGEVKAFDMEGFQLETMSHEINISALKMNQVLSYNLQSIQILVQIVDSPAELKKTPFFHRDQNFQKQAAKTLSTLMGLMLLLLLIDTTPPPPVKKVSVIYKKAIEAPTKSLQKSSSNSTNKDKNLGVKKKKQLNDKIKMAKKSAPKKKVKKTKPIKKVAKALKPTKAPPVKKVVKKAPKMKAYKFKMKKSMSSLFKNSVQVHKEVSNNSRSIASVEGVESLSSNTEKTLDERETVQVGTMGQDQHGQYDTSSGAQGLASKRGIDTTYANTKTVILGSIDPELLRKILREHLPQFRHCYQQELELNEAVKGIVDLNFRITGTGNVSKVNIITKSSRFSKNGVNCMAGVLKLIDFPKPKGGGLVDVKQPLNFLSERSRI